MMLSKKWIESNYTVYPNGQLFFIGMPIVTVKNEAEEKMILEWIVTACNNPQKFGVAHPVYALKKLKEKVKNRKCFQEGAYYEEKVELIKRCRTLMYNNSANLHCLTLPQERECFLDFCAVEILNACAEFKLGRSIEYIIDNYEFSSELFDDSRRLYDDLKLLHLAWGTDKLLKPLKHICDKSRVEGGFVDHHKGSDEILLNEYVECYI